MSDPGSAQLAYDQIRLAIVEGRFPAGGRLVEQRIAEEFGLSRTPVREALRRLEAEALIRHERNRGAVVREYSAEEIRDLYELRAHLEALGSARAATRVTAEEIAGLRDAVQAFDQSVADSRPHDVVAMRAVNLANSRLHRLILAASRHEMLGDILSRTVAVPLVFSAFAQYDEDGLRRSALFHRLILAAIETGDADRAAALMREHVFQGRDQLLSGLERAQSDSTDGGGA
jgi:DNA-binding GntR family transcriptional regulator